MKFRKEVINVKSNPILTAITKLTLRHYRTLSPQTYKPHTMKTFFYTAKYILKTIDNEYKEYCDHGIVVGDSYAEAMSQLEKFYDPEDLYELKIVSLRDDGITLLPDLPDVDLESAIVAENIC